MKRKKRIFPPYSTSIGKWIQEAESFYLARQRGQTARRKGNPKIVPQDLKKSNQKNWILGWEEEDRVIRAEVSVAILKLVLHHVLYNGINQKMMEAVLADNWNKLLKTPLEETIKRIMKKARIREEP